ncbi:MAG: hypothetical protein IIX02_06640 [Clostridia bacterium]|nr:hypothetical protein [Clostridia bacterium]
MGKITTTVLLRNEKVVIGTCSACKKEVGREHYESFFDFSRKEKRVLSIAKCPHCGEIFKEGAAIKWERTAKGDYIAKAKNGDFLVFKWGNVWKWRYRRYGETTPESVRTARTRQDAMAACERHGEFRGC